MKKLRILSTVLLISMVFSLVSCKKAKKKELIESIPYKSGQEILETDPFFDSEVNPVKLPIEEGREVYNTYLYLNAYFGDFAIGDYSIDYMTPDGVPAYQLPYEESLKYSSSGNGIFDSKGNYLMDMPKDISLIYDVAADPDGHLCVLGYGSNGEDMWHQILICAVIDKEGNVAQRITFTGAPFDPGCMMNPKLGFLSDGRYSIREQGILYVFSKKGELNYTVTDPERTLGTGIISKGGKNYVLSFAYDFETGENIQIKEVDIKTGTLGSSTDVSGLAAFGDLYMTVDGLFVTSSTGCYEYDIETRKLTKFFDWSDTDVNRSYFPSYFSNRLTPKNTDELFAIGITFDGNWNLIHLTRAQKNPHAGKKMIVVGGIDVANSNTLMTYISDYNSDPENTSRAVLVDYSENMEIGTSKADIENRVLLDILAGDGPDILVNFSESASFQKATVMEDLNPYLDSPEGISREQYFDNILRAQEKNGQLFHVPVRFSLTGLMANKKYISNTIGWTFDEFEEAASSIPEDVGLIEETLYKDFLEMILSSTMSSFVDYSNKTCIFQTDEMKKYLQIAREYGVERITTGEGAMIYFDGNRVKDESESYYSFKFESGLIALHKYTIENMEGYSLYRDHFKDPSCFLGYPSLDSSGAAAKSHLSIGIVATSKYKDLAWEFLREMLEYVGDPDFRDSLGFPVNRQFFEDENQRILSRSSFANKTDLDELREIIEACRTTLCYDAAMLDVITEEAAAYFAGDRSEDDVLKNIQNRCQLIMNERA